MKIIRANQTVKIKNSAVCYAIAYPLNEKKISIAIIKLCGRYPDHGSVINEKCDELVYVVKGTGTLVVEGKKTSFTKNDVMFIQRGERFYWDGTCELLMPCVPAWSPKQHKEVK